MFVCVEMCKESFAEDADVGEEEVDEELAIIRVQLAYLLQAQGRTAEANTLYNTVQKSRYPTPSITLYRSPGTQHPL